MIPLFFRLLGAQTVRPPNSVLLRASADGRYFENAYTEEPIRIKGDSAWTIVTELDLGEVRQYLDDRQARGFNLLIVQYTTPNQYSAGAHSPGAKELGGALPFLKNISGGTWTGVFANHDADFATPNDTYWDWVETILSECESRGMVVLGDYSYMGYNFGATSGWWQTMMNAGNTQTVCYEFGLYLGERFRHHPNHVIDCGTDMFPVPASEGEARFMMMLTGLQDAGCRQQLVSAHWARSSDARDEATFASKITFNGVYPGVGSGGGFAPDYARCRSAYARTPPVPCLAIETEYEGEGTLTRYQVRALAWWGQLSSTAGYVFGSTIWTFSSGWPALLGTPAVLDMEQMMRFFDGLDWWKLVPNGLGSIGTLITSGGGTSQTLGSPPGNEDSLSGYDYIAAAAAPDGSFLIAYVPDAHSGAFSIDMTKLSASALCEWVDPTSGGATTIGTFPNTGTHSFTVPASANGAGDHDWVLRITVT